MLSKYRSSTFLVAAAEEDVLELLGEGLGRVAGLRCKAIDASEGEGRLLAALAEEEGSIREL